MVLENSVERDFTKEECVNCMDYHGLNRCGEGHDMEKMKDEKYLCFSRHVSVMSYSGRKDGVDLEDT